MANVRSLSRSFAGGEIAPELFGRLDLDKFQTGLATCRNMVSLPHGPVENRAGFGYVLEAKDSNKTAALIPFVYNDEQAYVLEFGDQYLRIHTEGGTLLETGKNITGATKANPCVVTAVAHGFSAGDWVFIASVGGMTELNARYFIVNTVPTADTLTLKDLAGTVVNSTAFGTYTSGGTVSRVYQIATPYLEADLFDLHYTQSADVLTIVHQSYQQRELKRLGATNWTLTTLSFNPTQAAPTAVAAAATTGSGSKIYQYVVTALADDGLEESFASFEATSGSKAITGATKANPGVLTVVAHGLVAGDPVYISGVAGMTELNARYYTVNTAPTVDTITLKDADTGIVVNTTGYTTYLTAGTVYKIFIKNDLSTAGNKNTVSWTPAADAVRYNVYKVLNGLFGYIGQTDSYEFVDENIVPDVTQTPPEDNDPFLGSGNYPRAVGYYKGRRWFAGTSNGPQNAWATRAGTDSNLSRSIPLRDDDAIALRLLSRKANIIRHIVPLSDLLLLTSSVGWKIGAANSDAITPDTVDPRPESYIGASNVTPITTGKAVLFAQAQGNRIREMLYSWESQSYQTADVSLMVPHLFDGYTIKSMAYTEAPVPILWCVRSDGKLLGMTYVPEHKVVGWHWHDTDGYFESIAAIPESDGEDHLYAVVRRTVNGRQVRYIERMASRKFAALEDCFFVDSGATYSGAPATIITGLHHLENKMVSILADGAVVPQQQVTNGAITLPVAASKVHVGLPIVSQLKTLPVGFEAQALGQGYRKNVNKVWMRVNFSSGILVGPDENNLREYRQRTTEPYGSPPTPTTGLIEVTLDPAWTEDGQVIIQQTDPLPITVLSMVLEVATG